MDFEFDTVETIDKVPEQFRGIYTEGEGDDAGKFVVGTAFKATAEAISGFNKSNKTLRKEISEAKKGKVDLSSLSTYGDDPTSILEGIQTAITAASSTKNQDVDKAVKSAKEAMTLANKTAMDKSDQRNQGLQNQLYSLLVENNATSAIAEAKGVPELLMPFVKNQVKVSEEDGEFKVNVIDSDGEVRYGATGSQMSIKELITEMKSNEKYGRLFESEAPPGGGMPPGGGNRKPTPKGHVLSANEKIAAGLNKGQFTNGRGGTR